jgi:hypothetical protein
VEALGVVASGGALTHFATTRWSIIRNGHISGRQTEVNEDLASLCQIYWRPIFTFIYRRGYSAPDAQDLTQDFFLMILEGKLLQSADPSQGRFRSFLLRSLKNFLIDALVKRRRIKRGNLFPGKNGWQMRPPNFACRPARSNPLRRRRCLTWAGQRRLRKKRFAGCGRNAKVKVTGASTKF